MQPAIRIENLAKSYRINHAAPRGGYRTLRESLTHMAAAPLRRFRSGAADGTTEDFWALKDISFDVMPGEVVGIIGRNGAGKSTLLKILSRITKPSRGSVQLNGRVGSLLEVGTGFHPELTGRENVYLNGSILGMSRREIDRRFDEIVAFAEVERFLDTPVKRYSSGMYVRLAFAVAAHLEPEILIVDEVLAVGDASFQAKCLDKMRQSASSGHTVLIVSHQMNSVRDLCGRAIWLDDGTVRQSGSVGPVLERYLDETSRSVSPGDWIDVEGVSRVGTGQVRFTNARYYGPSTTEGPVSDGPLHIITRMKSKAHAAHLRVELQILDRYRTRLLTYNTFESGQPLRVSPGTTELTFRLDHLHLAPGRYPVNLLMGDASDLHDSVSEAFELDIHPPPGDSSARWGFSSLVTRTAHYEVS
jgi:lipopolysaccharide transport system ATP-binding protein